MVLLCRTTARADAAKPSDGMSVLLVDMREAVGNGLTIRPVRTMLNHATTELFFEDVRVPAANLIGEEGKGFKLHPRRDERRADPDRCGVHWRCEILHRPGERLRAANARFSAGRSARTKACSFRSPAPIVQMTAASHMVDQGRGAVRGGHSPAGPRPTWPSSRPRRRPGTPPTCAVQTHGGFGFAEEYDIERKFRETRLYQVAPISTNLILSHVATHVLDLPKSF